MKEMGLFFKTAKKRQFQETAKINYELRIINYELEITRSDFFKMMAL